MLPFISPWWVLTDVFSNKPSNTIQMQYKDEKHFLNKQIWKYNNGPIKSLITIFLNTNIPVCFFPNFHYLHHHSQMKYNLFLILLSISIQHIMLKSTTIWHQMTIPLFNHLHVNINLTYKPPELTTNTHHACLNQNTDINDYFIITRMCSLVLLISPWQHIIFTH